MNSKPVLFIRSLLFWSGFILNVIVFGLLIVFLFFIPSSFRLKIARLWSLSNNFLLKVFCGIDFKVEGKGNAGRKSEKDDGSKKYKN